MTQFIIPVEATISYEYVVEAKDIQDAISKIDEYISVKTDLVDRDVERVEGHKGYDDVDFNIDSVYENTGEYNTELLNSYYDDIWLGI